MTQSNIYVPMEQQEQLKEVIEQIRFQVGDEEIFVDKDIVDDHLNNGRVNFIPFQGRIVFLNNKDYDTLIKTQDDLKKGIR